MKLPVNSWGRQARLRPMSAFFSLLALLLIILALPGASAQVTHVANPFVGATQYVSPDYASEVDAVIATETPGSTLAQQMSVVAKYPTAVWMDHIGAIAGGSANNGRLGLQAHINAALAQQSGSRPIVITLVIYDLPNRDCESAAPNTPIGGTTPLVGTGIIEYENDFIAPIHNILAVYETNPNIRFVLVIEPDSLANMITNTGQLYSDANCIAANAGQSWPTISMSGVYVQGIQYALNQFHALPNAYTYLDAANAGWLGFTSDLNEAAPFFYEVAQGTVAGVSSIDGFVADTSNYVPIKEPFLTATEVLFGAPVDSATFYQGNPNIDEEDYAAAFDSTLIAAGFPTTLGMLIDTSRNGWGGPLRTTGPPTNYPVSETLNEYVNAAKIDERPTRAAWCNVENAGLGAPPTVVPGYFANLEAYLWIKPPGESDGTYPGSIFNGVAETTGNPECNPACNTVLCQANPPDSFPNSPPKGVFFPAAFTQLVQDAYPAVSIAPPPGFTLTPSAATVNITAGSSVTDVITITDLGGFTGAVTLSVSGLPSTVTAVIGANPATSTSVITLTASVALNCIGGGISTITVTGISGTLTQSTTFALSPIIAPLEGLGIGLSSTALTVTQGGSVADTITANDICTGSGITFSASGLPSGVAASFTANPVNGSTVQTGTNVLTLTAGNAAAVGSSTVTITASAGGLTTVASLTLTVKPLPSFTLAPSIASLSVTPGSSATDTITVTDLGGFTGSVTLAATGLPTG
ncbi:MAG: glycoside hydrolase family 6 protein, partial [Terracidiphilus sp.]